MNQERYKKIFIDDKNYDSIAGMSKKYLYYLFTEKIAELSGEEELLLHHEYKINYKKRYCIFHDFDIDYEKEEKIYTNYKIMLNPKTKLKKFDFNIIKFY